MSRYQIKFISSGKLRQENFAARSAGQAFEACLEKFPGARLIEAVREGAYLEGYGRTTYEPPSLVRVQAESAHKEVQLQLKL